MTMLRAVRGMRSALIAGLPLTLLIAAGGADATASPGCDAVNAGGFNGQAWKDKPFKKTISGFAAGDVLSLDGGGRIDPMGYMVTLSTGNGTFLEKIMSGVGATITYTVTGLNDDTTLTVSVFTMWGLRGSGSGKCTPGDPKLN